MKAALCILLASTLIASAAEPGPLTLEKSIPLPAVQGGFDLMAVDVAGQRLFLCAEENNTVEVYDDARHRIYVSCGAGVLEVIAQKDADHYALAASIPTAKGAGASWLSPELDRLYLAVPAHESQPAELRVYRPPAK